MYRPSLGICESRAAFRQAMRESGTVERKSRRDLRRMARRERRHYLRQVWEAARERREARPSRLLPTRPEPRQAEAVGEAEAGVTETAAISTQAERGPSACTALPQASALPQAGPLAQVGFSGIPWTYSGPFSLNPLPRYAAREDLDWRR